MAFNRWHLVHLAGWIVAVVGLVLAWFWAREQGWTDPDLVREILEPYRTSWIGLPVVVLVFVVAELFLFPVLLLIAGCGMAFGPWLGAVYALIGSLAGAILPFLIGRWVGQERLKRWGGPPARKLVKSLHGKGLVAAFLVRKVPAPFSLVNMVCGASGLKLRDFALGTLLGMSGGILVIVMVGANVGGLASGGRPAQLALGAGMLVFALALSLLLQRYLNRRLGRSQ